METSLTRRGWTVVAVTVGCVLLGAIWGARSLNAVVVPAVVGLGAALVTVRRAEQPTVERTVPPDGPPGTTGEVVLHVERAGMAIYTLRDRVPAWLSAPDTDYDLTEDSATVRYEVRYDRRGAHRIGPLAVTVTDSLGLVERQLPAVGGRDVVLVYPRLVEPPGALRSSLEAVVDLERRPGRDEFDRLREYVRGDSPRDVHWKSSAKQPDDDLVVKEFLGRTPTDAVRIAVGGSGDRDSLDAAATATASVAITLLDEGVDVGLVTPTERIEPGVGSAQRESILAALARFEGGEPDASDATLRVSTGEGEALVHVAGRAIPFRAAGERSEAGSEAPPRSAEQPRGPTTEPDATEVHT